MYYVKLSYIIVSIFFFLQRISDSLPRGIATERQINKFGSSYIPGGFGNELLQVKRLANHHARSASTRHTC